MTEGQARTVRLKRLFRRRDITGRADLPLLSVYRDFGVVPREGRNDNFNRASEDLTAYQLVRPGDLVLNKMKTWQGSLGISQYEGIVSPAYFVGEPVSSDDRAFLHHLLRSQPLIAEYGRRSKGIRPSQWDLPWEEFVDIEITLPSITVQEAIADFLDRETARIDALTTAKRRMIEIARSRFDAVISREIWNSDLRRKRLKFLFGRPTSGNRDHEFTIEVDGVPCLRGLNIREGHVDELDLMRISPKDHAQHKSSALRSGDTVIVRSGSAGTTAVVPRELDGANCVDLVIIRRREGYPSELLAFTLNSREAREQIALRTTGSILTHFNAEAAAELSIPDPSEAEAENLTDRLAAERSRFERLSSLLDVQVSRLADRRAAVITAAVTGEMHIPAAMA